MFWSLLGSVCRSWLANYEGWDILLCQPRSPLLFLLKHGHILYYAGCQESMVPWYRPWLHWATHLLRRTIHIIVSCSELVALLMPSVLLSSGSFNWTVPNYTVNIISGMEFSWIIYCRYIYTKTNILVTYLCLSICNELEIIFWGLWHCSIHNVTHKHMFNPEGFSVEWLNLTAWVLNYFFSFPVV